MLRTIILVTPDDALAQDLRSALYGLGDTVAFASLGAAFDFITLDIPHLLIVDFRHVEAVAVHLDILKGDPLFASLPVLAILDENKPLPDWEHFLVDDYLMARDVATEIAWRSHLCLLRAERVVEINPLTRLPGNISINRQIQSRLDRGAAFALSYADIDDFKPFNDKYGFSHGDDVIRITGRLLLNMVKNCQPQESFVGHIGGDDFVFLTPVEGVEHLCSEVTSSFDKIVPTFYGVEDREAGCITSKDREGRVRQFDIMSLSVGVVLVSPGMFLHYGEVTSVAAEMKKEAKRQKGSCWRMNRRIYPETAEPGPTA